MLKYKISEFSIFVEIFQKIHEVDNFNNINEKFIFLTKTWAKEISRTRLKQVKRNKNAS